MGHTYAQHSALRERRGIYRNSHQRKRERGHHQRFQRLLSPPGDGDLLQITGSGDLGNGQQLAGGGEEFGLGE